MQTKIAIYYFSATGNGLDISNKLAKQLKGDIFPIEKADKNTIEKYERTVFVFPIYCFGLPNNVKDWIVSLQGANPQNCYVVLHYGGFSGNARNFTKNFFAANGIAVRAVYKLQMPESFTVFAAPPEFWIKGQLAQSQKKVENIVQNILAGKQNKAGKNIFAFTEKMHNKASAAWANGDQNFIVTDACVSCGDCVKMCPVKNITLQDGKPQFGGGCVSCLACYHRCPEKAINYGTATIGKARYINPNVSL